MPQEFRYLQVPKENVPDLLPGMQIRCTRGDDICEGEVVRIEPYNRNGRREYKVYSCWGREGHPTWVSSRLWKIEKGIEIAPVVVQPRVQPQPIRPLQRLAETEKKMAPAFKDKEYEDAFI